MAGEPSFIEFGVPDPERSRAFYEQLFGWQFTMLTHGAEIDMPNAGVGISGGVHVETDDAPQIIVYFRVDDLDTAMERVRQLGGQVLPVRPPSPVYGAFAECKDPDGVLFGLRQLPTES